MSASRSKKPKATSAPTIATSQNTRDALLGHWTMLEARKESFYDDVIRFPVGIISVDAGGKVVLEWGDSGRIEGKWDERRQVLTVFGDQSYVLHDGVLGGGSGRYSGAAYRDDVVGGAPYDSIVGLWRMTEYRRDANKDIIQFDVDIQSVDENGNVDLIWGGSGRIAGRWDGDKKTLTVFDDQVYILYDRILGGGSATYSGIAMQRAY